MGRLLSITRFAALLMVTGVALSATPGAAEKSPVALKVIDRAVQVAAETSQYAAEVEHHYASETAAGHERQRSVENIAYRSPVRYWSYRQAHSSKGVMTVMMLGDGDYFYRFVHPQPAHLKRQRINDISTIAVKNYPQQQFKLLSPLAEQIYDLAAWRGDATVAMAYQGRLLVDGMLCEAVEFSVPMTVRENKSDLPTQSGMIKHRVYIAVEDGLLRRQVSASEIPGGSKQWTEANYTVKTLSSDELFTYQRLTQAIKPLMGGQPLPQIQETYNDLGQPLPEVNAVLENGARMRWQDYRGKVLVVQTWASWCGPCKRAMPFYERMRRRLATQDVVFIALNFEQEPQRYEKWVKENRARYGFVFARAQMSPQNWHQELDKFKGSLPGFYVVGRNGNVVAGYGGYGYSADEEDPRLLVALAKAGINEF